MVGGLWWFQPQPTHVLGVLWPCWLTIIIFPVGNLPFEGVSNPVWREIPHFTPKWLRPVGIPRTRGDKPSSPPGGHGHHDSHNHHNHHHQGHHDHYNHHNHHNHGFGFGGASSIISRTSFVSYTAELLILIDISGSAMCCQQTVLLLEWGERSLVFDVCFFERIVQNTAELFPAQSMSTSMIGPHDHSFCEFHFQDHQLDVSELDVSEMRYTPTMWWGKWWWTNGFRGANFWTNPNGITPSILIQSKVWTFPIWALVEAVRVVSWHPCRTQLDAPSAWLGNT